MTMKAGGRLLPALLFDRMISIGKLFVVGLIVWLAFLSVYSDRCLYADGSNFLLHILINDKFLDFDKPRIFVQIITQVPVVFAMKLGICDISTLIKLYSVGLIVLPLICWLMALLIHYKNDNFWLFLLAFSAVYFNSGFFAIGEYNLTYAMAALVAALLVKREPLNFGYCLLLVLLAFALIRSYQSMVFLGPLLCSLSVLRLFIFKKTTGTFLRGENIAVLLGCFFCILALAISFASIVSAPAQGNISSAISVSAIWCNKQFVFTFVAIAICCLSCWFQDSFIVKILSLLVAGSFVFFVANEQLWLIPANHYFLRAFAGLILFLVLFLISICFYFSANSDRIVNRYGKLIVIFLFISLLIPFVSHCNGFSRWIKKFELKVNSSVGLVAWEDTDLMGRGGGQYVWFWTNPTLSLLLQKNGKGAVILVPAGTVWQPFDPAKELPVIPAKFKKQTLLF